MGNVVLYGATSGEAFFNGVAGERFAIRNSGAHTVVEGVGDHCCEYMTGGYVVIIGETGVNFAAGMSGGIAYVLNESDAFPGRCNMDLVALETLQSEDLDIISNLLHKHVEYTGSPKAKRILASWESYVRQFVKIMPIDYKRVLMERGELNRREIA